MLKPLLAFFGFKEKEKPYVVRAVDYISKNSICARTEEAIALREAIKKALQDFNRAHLDLNGYNRYTFRFMRECLGELVYTYNPDYLLSSFTWDHKSLPSYNLLVEDILLEAYNKRYPHEQLSSLEKYGINHGST